MNNHRQKTVLSLHHLVIVPLHPNEICHLHLCHLPTVMKNQTLLSLLTVTPFPISMIITTRYLPNYLIAPPTIPSTNHISCRMMTRRLHRYSYKCKKIRSFSNLLTKPVKVIKSINIHTRFRII